MQRVLRFLPSANLSLFVYLLAFLSQVNQTKAGIEVTLGHAFGPWVFGVSHGPDIMAWFIKNWVVIVTGLFDLDWDVAVSSSDTVRLPEQIRADSLESLLPSPYDGKRLETGD